MKVKKQKRQILLQEKISETPFITDESLAKLFSVSVQTIRLDRLELGIPELRARIKNVATHHWDDTVKALPLEDVIGDIIDLELDQRAISIFTIQKEHVFSRNEIARGHHLFAQANSLAVAVIDDALALTSKSEIRFKRQVHLNEQVIAKATVKETDSRGRTVVNVESFVKNELVFEGIFYMYRSNEEKGKS